MPKNDEQIKARVDMWDISHYNAGKERIMSFELEVYVKENGEIPFDDFMKGLNSKLQAKVLRDLDVLEKFGNELRAPYSKALGDGIFELRTIMGNDIARTLYFFYIDKKIVITHGFLKKQQKTPAREKEKAMRYREDWLRRHSDEIQ